MKLIEAIPVMGLANTDTGYDIVTDMLDLHMDKLALPVVSKLVETMQSKAQIIKRSKEKP